MRPALCAAFFCLLQALPARAAGPAEGRATAAAEAGLRAEGAVLVEIEGFTSPEGDIPCKGQSYSNSWHYKFYVPASGEWLIINACGDNFINASKHLPYLKAAEPVQPVPYSYAAPAAVLTKLREEELFTPEPNRFSRDVQMTLRLLPAKDGRPAGCYWTVAQGKNKALADCEAGQAWKLTKAAKAAAGAAGSGGQTIRGKDTAGRYTSLAVEIIRKKIPDAQLVFIQALTDRTGSAKCIDPKDGWTYVFSSRSAGLSTYGGCKGKGAAEYINFDGAAAVDVKTLDPLILPFKDSDFSLSQVPKECVSAHPTISMKLGRYKAGHSPAGTHSQVWTINCGTQKYYVDANTGLPVKAGKK